MHKLMNVLSPLVIGVALGWMAHDYNNKHVESESVISNQIIKPVFVSQQVITNDTFSPDKKTLNMMALLQAKNYVEAMEYFEYLQSQVDAGLTQQARVEILMHGQALVKAHDYVSAVQYLERFLMASFRDIDARLLLSEAYIGQGDYLVAIEQLYEARGLAFRPQMITRITQRIRLVVSKQAEIYRKNKDDTGLLVLYQNLSQKEPDYAHWFVELALAQLALDDPQSAQFSLALVTSDPDVGEQARTLLLKLQQLTTEPVAISTDITGIPLTRKGHSFLVAASIQYSDEFQLLIDTGASMTIVTPEVLQASSASYKDTGSHRVFNTANGAITAPVYILESLTVGDWTLEQLEVGVLDLQGFDGLLGMNFLRHFRFFIDQHESTLRLSQN